ncbi:PTS sugar transporter subunit IIA [Paracoccus tegillarcae]|uniref:PTS fructose transporter subunit IIA n=1 Tax=Paracoccus tegillarcae TaxID=1529068 RepID=A0A2K9ELJ2_9RHOB|nr:PTS fructose transporter subunit IIA [Paracoccus tegillarcae]AUH32465.1 PTS fructose transporter subunit IIA [Paracoccus tegillarcae]
MIGIVIVAHGGLAREYLSAVEHVVGPQVGIRAVTFEAEHDRAEKKAEIMEAANAVDTGDGVVVVVDLIGSSPANLALPACALQDRTIIYGANMPMLLALAKSRNQPIAKAVAKAEEAGRKYINSYTVPVAS